MTTVVNLHKSRYDIYCGRPGPWGNPYHIGPDDSRTEVIAKHRKHIRHRIELGDLRLEQLAELSGKRLGCYCQPQPCHADHLARLSDRARDLLDAIARFEQQGTTAQAMVKARMLATRALAQGQGQMRLNDAGCLEFKADETSETVLISPNTPNPASL